MKRLMQLVVCRAFGWVVIGLRCKNGLETWVFVSQVNNKSIVFVDRYGRRARVGLQGPA